MATRRVVTGLTPDGKSTFVLDSDTPRTVRWEDGSEPNLEWVWSTESTPIVPHELDDPTKDMVEFFPGRHGSRFMIETFPPGFGLNDIAAASQNIMLRLNAAGINVKMDKHEGVDHATSTIDYGVVLSGQIWLGVDDGETCLNPGDCVVQTGVSHAWRNRGTKPCTIAFVILGAERKAGGV